MVRTARPGPARQGRHQPGRRRPGIGRGWSAPLPPAAHPLHRDRRGPPPRTPRPALRPADRAPRLAGQRRASLTKHRVAKLSVPSRIRSLRETGRRLSGSSRNSMQAHGHQRVEVPATASPGASASWGGRIGLAVDDLLQVGLLGRRPKSTMPRRVPTPAAAGRGEQGGRAQAAGADTTRTRRSSDAGPRRRGPVARTAGGRPGGRQPAAWTQR